MATIRFGAVLTTLFALPAAAQPIPVGDPGFEQTVLNPCGFIQGFANGSPWSVVGGGGAWRPGSCWDINPFEGTTIAYSNGGVVQQVLTTNAIPGTDYTLTVAVGRRNNPCCPFQSTRLVVDAGTGDARVNILTRDIVTAEAPAPGSWARFRVTGTLPAGAPSGLPLVISLSAAGAQVDFDAVTLDRGNGCAADFNGDGFLDFFDYADYVTCFETASCPPGTSADFNADGFVDFFDYADFVAAFEAGC
jgi:hypothetical protein